MTIINDPYPPVAYRFEGARVLLAEDSKINQQIALELLARAGLQVDIANNGEEALQLLEKNVFSVVLMDLQMPVIDGYQATSIIRQQHKYKDLPIIAMTADANAADREKCLSTGMNDHIVKSLDPRDLYAALDKWLTSRTSPLPAAFPDAAALVPSAPVLPPQLAGIDLPQALNSVGGNARLLKKLLLEFLQDHASDEQRIRQAMDNGDILQARRIAHTLQGISGSLGMNAINAISSALDNGLRNDELDFCRVLLEALAAPLEEVMVSLGELARADQEKTPPAISTAPVNREQCLLLVDDIAVAINDMSPDAESKAEALVHLLAGSPHGLMTSVLLGQLGEFDFDAAEQTLQQLTNALMAS